MKSNRDRDGAKPAPASSRDTRAWTVSAILVVGMVIAGIAGFVFVSQLLSTPSTPTLASSSSEGKSLGSESASVKVVVYGDFQ